MNKFLEIDRYKAILFDLDGTLADTMPLHNRVWIDTLRHHGCRVSEDTLWKYTGVPNIQTVEIFNELFGWTLDPRTIATEKESMFLARLGEIKPIKPVLDVANHYVGKKMLAIVSGGTREIVTKTLDAIGCRSLFDPVVCAEDTDEHKPKAAPYLHAAKILRVSPADCIVLEDGEMGIASAVAAGMAYIKV